MTVLNPWSDVAVDVESAIAAPVTVTAITQANPAVVTAANSLSPGDWVYLEVRGMQPMNRRVAKVTAATGTDFTLGGIDSSAMAAFKSGTFAALTMDGEITTATSVSASGGEPTFADASVIHDKSDDQFPVSTGAITYSFELFWDPTDAGQQDMVAAADAIGRLAFVFTFVSGAQMAFSGYVSTTGAPSGQTRELAKLSVTITVNGRPSYYGS